MAKPKDTTGQRLDAAGITTRRVWCFEDETGSGDEASTIHLAMHEVVGMTDEAKEVARRGGERLNVGDVMVACNQIWFRDRPQSAPMRAGYDTAEVTLVISRKATLRLAKVLKDWSLRREMDAEGEDPAPRTRLGGVWWAAKVVARRTFGQAPGFVWGMAFGMALLS